MKLGPLPMYVIAPKNTEPRAIALSKISDMPATAVPWIGNAVATLWNATAVGALSRNELKPPAK